MMKSQKRGGHGKGAEKERPVTQEGNQENVHMESSWCFQTKTMVRWYCQSNTNIVYELGIITEEKRQASLPTSSKAYISQWKLKNILSPCDSLWLGEFFNFLKIVSLFMRRKKEDK